MGGDTNTTKETGKQSRLAKEEEDQTMRPGRVHVDSQNWRTMRGEQEMMSWDNPGRRG